MENLLKESWNLVEASWRAIWRLPQGGAAGGTRLFWSSAVYSTLIRSLLAQKSIDS
jgi:hypothetical protein